MKKIILGASIAVLSLMATDFSQMSLEELTALRGTVAVEDRDAFRAEMQSRMLALSPEERSAYIQNNRGQALGQQVQNATGRPASAQTLGINQRLRDGSGAGSMNQGTRRGAR